MARPSLFSNKKFVRLSMLLGRRYIAVGVLEMLWHHAYESGDEVLGTSEMVEYMADWDGEPGVLAAALEEAGFIDDLGDGRYGVHDLLDHAPDYVRKRQAREAQRRANGRTEPRQSPGSDQPVSDADQSVTGQRPVSDRTLTPTPAPAPAPNKTCSSPTDERWSEFWAKYPRKVGRKRAELAFKNLKAGDQKAALDALPMHMNMWDTRPPDKIPHAATWLNGARWEDDLDEGGVMLSRPRRLYNPDTGEFDEVT